MHLMLHMLTAALVLFKLGVGAEYIGNAAEIQSWNWMLVLSPSILSLALSALTVVALGALHVLADR